MSKFNEFLKETTEISNKDRLQTVMCTLALAGIGMVLNHKLYKERIKNIDLEIEKAGTEIEMDLLKQKINTVYDMAE